MYASANNKPHVQISSYWRNRLIKLQETIYVVCIQWILLMCFPTRLRGSVFLAARSSNTENCLNTFIGVTYRACWTRIAEKCSLLPSWRWSPAVDGPILIWGLPPWGSKSSIAFKVRQRWLWLFWNLVKCVELLLTFVFFFSIQVSLHWDHAAKESSVFIFFKSFYQLLRVFSSKFGTLLFILIFVATPWALLSWEDMKWPGSLAYINCMPTPPTHTMEHWNKAPFHALIVSITTEHEVSHKIILSLPLVTLIMKLHY